MPLVKDYYHDIDLHANQLFNSRLHNISTAARIILGGTLGLGDKGYMVYDTDVLNPYFWDGVAWQQTGGSATWGSITGSITSQTDLTAYLTANYYPLSSNPANYLTSAAANLLYYPLSSNPAGYLTSETDPVFSAWLATPPNISTFNNDAGYITSESDPAFSSWLSTPPNISTFINDSGYLSSVPTLQQVCTSGYTYDATVNPITLTQGTSLYNYLSNSGYQVIYAFNPNFTYEGNLGYSKCEIFTTNAATAIVEGIQIMADKIKMYTGVGGANQLFLRFNNSASTVRNIYFPNQNGTLPLTVNGQSADSSGAITIPVGTGTVTGVTASSPLTSSGGTAPNISTSMSTNRLIGRTTAGTGVMEEISVGTGLTLSSGTLSSNVTGISKGTAAGTDTYTTTISGVTAYNDGDAYLIRFTNGNTTGCTLNINGLGARTLYRNNDGALIGGDIISGAEMLCIYNSTLTGFQTIGTAPNTLLGYVTNDDSVTITKGQVVYAFGGTGDRMTVKLANNTSDATSARTVGVVLSTSIAANQKGFIMMQGLLDGLSILPTSTYNDGDSVYLGTTPGSITNVKPYAPNHLVYVATVTTASNGSAGRMYVNIQNGYELDELHNVQAQSPALKDTLWYDSGVTPGQWKTASIPTILGYTPQVQLNGTGFVKASGTTISYDNSTYQNQLNGTGFVKAAGTTISYDNNTYRKVIVNDTTQSTGVVGTTAETLVKTYEITAGTLSTSGFLDFTVITSRDTASISYSVLIRINSTNNFATATLLSTSGTAGNFAPYMQIERRGILRNNLLHMFPPATSGTTDRISAVAGSNLTCNNTSSSVWIFVSLVNGSTAPRSFVEGVLIVN